MDNDIYGRTVSMTTDGVTDTYLVGGAFDFALPAGTNSAVAYLAFAKQGKLLQFKSAITEFGQNHYDATTQQQLVILYLAAKASEKVDREAYLAQLFAFVNSVTAYSVAFSAAVNACSDPSTIAAMQWDLSQIASDPGVTLAGAIAIST